MNKSNRLLIVATALSLVAPMASAAAQDVRGMEACMTEKAIERRTGCLQANIEFLQQEMAKLKRDMQNQSNAANRDAAAAKTENAALKAALTKLEADVSQLKERTEPAKK